MHCTISKRSRLRRILVKTLALGLFFSIGIYTQAKSLSIVTINYPPYIIDENKGIAIETVKSVLNEMSVDYNIKIKTWKYSYQRVVDGRADAIFTIFETDERKKLLLFSGVNIVKQSPAFFFRKKNKKLQGVKTVNINNINQYTFGLINKFNYGEKFDLLKASNTINKFVFSNNLDLSLKKLLRGRSDIIVHDEYAFLYRISNSTMKDFIAKLDFDLGYKNSYIAFSRKTMDQNFVKQFDSYLSKFVKSSEYKVILNKYTN